MIQTFSCNNFRNIKVENLELEKINILIGPNNSGKTNFIKALSFFANVLTSGNNNNFKSSFLNEVSKNSWNKLINKYAEGNPEVSFELKIKLKDEENIIYKFSFVGGNMANDFHITKEELSDGNPRRTDYFRCHSKKNKSGVFAAIGEWEGDSNLPHISIERDISDQDTILNQFNDKAFWNVTFDGTSEIVDALQKYLKGFYSYSSSQFDLNKIKQPSDAKEQGVALNSDGSNLANVLNYYISKDIYLGRRFEERLRELLPKLETTRISSEFEKLVFRMGYDGKQFDLSDMSDGTLKAILMAALTFIPIEDFSLFAIDEPEMNLHPAWQKIIAKWIQLSNNFSQCFVSTHSPDFLDEFTDGFKNNAVGLYVFNTNENNIVKVKYEDLKSELDGWMLGDLYRTNEPLLGGWPW